jgi:hypothetical protein
MRPHDVLEVSPGADAREVTAAFRRFALRHHPDRGGDPEHFRQGAEAYRNLVGAARPGAVGAAGRRADVVFHRRSRSPLAALLRRARLTVTRPRP